jgi:SRSO17 transposase
VLGVTGQHHFWSWYANLDVARAAEDIAKGIPDRNWVRLSAGAGSKGRRLFDWAYLPLVTLRPDALDAALNQSLWTCGLPVRRSLSDGALAYFTTWCPAGTPVERLVMVERRRWAIEDAFETAKTELGLAHDESRSWHGWHRHVSLVMLAPVRRLANRPSPKKDTHRQARRCRGPFRRSGAWRCGWRSGASSPPWCSPGQPGGAPTKLPLDRRISEEEPNCNASVLRRRYRE